MKKLQTANILKTLDRCVVQNLSADTLLGISLPHPAHRSVSDTPITAPTGHLAPHLLHCKTMGTDFPWGSGEGGQDALFFTTGSGLPWTQSVCPAATQAIVSPEQDPGFAWARPRGPLKYCVLFSMKQICSFSMYMNEKMLSTFT